MEKLMDVLEAHKINKHGVVLLGQNEDLDILSSTEIDKGNKGDDVFDSKCSKIFK